MEFSFNHTTVCFIFSLITNRGLHKCCYMFILPPDPPPTAKLNYESDHNAAPALTVIIQESVLGSACGIVWFGQLPGPVFCTCQLFRSRSGLISSSCLPLPHRTSPTHHDRAELLTSSPNLPKHM